MPTCEKSAHRGKTLYLFPMSKVLCYTRCFVGTHKSSYWWKAIFLSPLSQVIWFAGSASLPFLMKRRDQLRVRSDPDPLIWPADTYIWERILERKLFAVLCVLRKFAKSAYRLSLAYMSIKQRDQQEGQLKEYGGGVQEVLEAIKD